MKLLHTSDWHVGKAIRGASRADEHRAVLSEIAAIAEREAVDLVVVAGDLFDSSAPSPESQEIVYGALLALSRTGAEVAVIAGNHDNARALRAVAPVFKLGRVRMVTEPTRPDDGGVLAIRTRDGIDVRLALLPFVSKRGIIRAEDLMDQEMFENAQLYSDRLRLLIDVLCSGFGVDTVNVLVAHTFVLGAVPGGGERAAHLVDEYAVTSQSFPATIGYTALGHLHRPQRVPAGPPVQYCGSPLQLDFGETDQTKQVNLVRLEPGAPADMTPVPLASGRRLRTLSGTIDELATMTNDDDAWLRVIVRGSTRAGLAEYVRDVLGDRVVAVQVDSPAITGASRASDHHHRSPQELFDDYLAAEGVDDDRVRDLFGDLLDVDHEGVRA
jgi:DNA repair protein SbcD/Mre11